MRVTWGTPGNGGSPITSYVVTLTATAGPSTGQVLTETVEDPSTFEVVFADVPAGTWQARVRAVNAVGEGPESAPSEPVTVAGDLGPEPEPDPEPEPSEPDTEPVPDQELTEENAGGVQVPGGGEPVEPGSEVTAQVGRQFAGQWVSGWVHSDPVWLGWLLVDESGRVQVELPADVPAGEHKLVFKDTGGELIGWDALTVAEVKVPVVTSVSAADARGVYGKPVDLAVTVDPAATGSVSVELPGGVEPLTGELVGGVAAVRVPARALEPGAYELAVSYAGVPGEFEPSTGTVSVRVVKADPRVRVQLADRRVGRGETAVVRVRVSGAGVDPSGVVRVRIGRLVETVELNAHGRRVVRIELPPRAKPGQRTVTVVYAGDEHVAREKVTRTLRITR